MSDAAVPGAILLLLREIMNAWANRNEWQAAKGAGRLTFWGDGMLQQLEAIGKGKQTPEVVRELRKGSRSQNGQWRKPWVA